MIYLESGLYVRVQQVKERAPMPLPLSSGFNEETAYRVLGIYNPSETAEAYFILSNDRNEVWFISQRHFRTIGMFNTISDFNLPLSMLTKKQLTPAY